MRGSRLLSMGRFALGVSAALGASGALGCASASPDGTTPGAAARAPEAGFFAGAYEIVGRTPAGLPYTGWARLEPDGDELVADRCVGGVASRTAVEFSTVSADAIPALRTHFPVGDELLRATCQIHVDFDNYARLTCFTEPEDGERVVQPGLETLFFARWPRPESLCG